MENSKEKPHTDDKPVGYGSSIQSSGYGSRARPQQIIDGTKATTSSKKGVKNEEGKGVADK